jgi:His-Xaa-Ser system protein HxsD
MREILQDGSVRLVIDNKLFSREAVLKAGYWATRDAFITFEHDTEADAIIVMMRAKAGDLPTLDNPRPVTSSQLADQFENSLIDFQLREQIGKDTSVIRELILTKAFAESGVFEDVPVGSPFDPVSEPASLLSSSSPLKILSSSSI